MAFNIRSGGDHQEVPVPATVKGGDVVVLGDITGVAELGATLRDDGQYWTTVALEGVAYLPMEEAPSELGVAVYVTETSGEVAELGSAEGDYHLVGYVINDAKTANGGYAVKLANGTKVEI